ncbi:MAG: zinc ribbon domain-containing protein [Promethearchaeota archaeon]
MILSDYNGMMDMMNGGGWNFWILTILGLITFIVLVIVIYSLLSRYTSSKAQSDVLIRGDSNQKSPEGIRGESNSTGNRDSFCPHCGRSLQDKEMKYCPTCGSEI